MGPRKKNMLFLKKIARKFADSKKVRTFALAIGKQTTNKTKTTSSPKAKEGV